MNKYHTAKLSTPGERLRYIRTLAQLTRDSVTEKFNISSATLRSWEDNKVNISDEKIKKCLSAYRSIGILTNVEWIKTGEGIHPILEGKTPKFIERLLLMSDKMNISEEVDMDFLKNQTMHSSKFISYLDQEEVFTFVNSQYEEIFNRPVNEIIGENLRELIGEQGYNIVKPYLDRALNGEEVSFDYAWKYEENVYRYLNLHFIPHIVNNKTVGIFSFIEDKEPNYALEYDNSINFEKPNLKENCEYKHDLFIDCANLIYETISEMKIKLNLKTTNNIILDLYVKSTDKHQIDNTYMDFIIDKIERHEND